MKILYISSSVIPSKSANSVHVMKMCQAFAKNDHDVVLLCRKGRSLDHKQNDYDFYGVDPNFKIKRVLTTQLRGDCYFSAIQSALIALKDKPDMVYGRSILGCYLSTLLGVETVLEVHQPPKDMGVGVEGFCFNRIVKSKKLKKIVVISNALKLHILENYKIKNSKIFTAHDGADCPKLTAKYDRKKTRFQIGYVGHLYKGRGVEVIIEMAKKCSWADFSIIGGNEADISYWENKTKHISNIHLLGYLPPSEVEKRRSHFDVLLAPYQYEVAVAGGSGNTVNWMSPLKVFEYMSSKKPIISSDLPVLREVLKHEHNALLCSPNNVDEWKNALERLKEDKSLRNQLANTAYKELLKNYTWESRAKKVLA